MHPYRKNLANEPKMQTYYEWRRERVLALYRCLLRILISPITAMLRLVTFMKWYYPNIIVRLGWMFEGFFWVLVITIPSAVFGLGLGKFLARMCIH